MRKGIYLLISCLLTTVLYAQESEISVVREDTFLVQKELAVWRTDQMAGGQARVYTCQAVRLQKDWFLTAAHCVYSMCHGSIGNLPCTVQITLAEGELRQTVRINNSTSDKNVFIYEGFFPAQNRISSLDVALVKVDKKVAHYAYEKWNEDAQSWESISQEKFNKLLTTSPETKAQLSAVSPRLVSVANLSSSRFRPQLVVPRITEGIISYLVEPSQEVFYVSDLQHFISPGFGVRRGNSGGGVFTAQGDLTGLVSSLVYAKDGSASFHNNEGTTVLTLKNANDYFLFTGFTASTLNFIRNHVPNLRVIGAENGFVEATDKDFKAIIKSINQSSLTLE